MVFATIGFALKSGLALGSAAFLWIMADFFNYDTKLPDAPAAIAGYRAVQRNRDGHFVADLHRAAGVLPTEQNRHDSNGE